MFDRTTCCELQAEIVELLKQRYPQFHVESCGGKFSSKNLTIPIEIAVVNSNGQAETQEVHEFKVNSELYGLKASDLGNTFHSPGSGQMFRVVGLKPRNRRYPILAERVSDGKQFKFSASLVKQAL